jgi:hypothetical protein
MTKHIHYEAIMAWANGATIELHDPEKGTWHDTDHPSWYDSLNYRIKPEPKPDVVHETSISLSPFAGPLLHTAIPLEANCVLVFDGETNKLKGCTFRAA